MDKTRPVGPIEREDVEIWSPVKGWVNGKDWVYLTPEGIRIAQEKRYALPYTFRWRVKR